MNEDMREKLIKIGAVVIFFGILALVGQIFKKPLEEFRDSQHAKVYPKPAEMPAAVQTSVEDVLARLQQALEKNDRGLAGRMQAGLNADAIRKVQNDTDCALPGDLPAFFAWHDGSSRAESDLQWFCPLRASLLDVVKKRGTHDQQSHGGIASRGLAEMSGYMQDWVPLYRDTAYFSLNVDLSRTPEEGAYFWTGSNAGGFYFFPSLPNALTALAECFEKGVFKETEVTEKANRMTNPEAALDGVKKRQLVVDTDALRRVMDSYGTWMDAEGMMTR